MKSQKQRFYFRRPEVISSTPKAKKERMGLNLKPLKNLFYLLCLFAILYLIIFSSTFKIKEVEIEGVKSVEISDYLNQTLIGRNILLMRTGKYLSDLSSKFPILEEASLVRGLPSTVKINVHERSQELILCNDQGCYEVDSRGYAYQKIPKPLDKVVLIDQKNLEIKETDKLFSDSFIKFYLDAIDELGKAGVQLKEARMDETTFKISFVSTEGWSAILDSSGNLANQVSAVKQVLANNKQDLHEYVDVRVEGVAYIK